MLKFALIIGSTRIGRFADKAAEWIVAGAQARSDFALDVLDLREHALPMFNERTMPTYGGGSDPEPLGEAWRALLSGYDGFIATAAEYNHGPTAVLKNALDSGYRGWRRKPIAFVGYGGVGAARAIEHLRGIAIELQMAPVKQEVSITRDVFVPVRQQGKTLDDFPHLAQARTATFDDLVWWGKALKAARDAG